MTASPSSPRFAEPRGLAIGLLVLSLVVYGVTSLAPETLRVGLGSPVLLLWKVMAVACIGAYGIALLWWGARSRTRGVATVALALWVALNLVVWTAPLVRAAEPTACAADGQAVPQSIPARDPCDPCDDGTWPLWLCILAGCW